MRFIPAVSLVQIQLQPPLRLPCRALRDKAIFYGPVVKRPKTPPFHGGNTGSNPVRVTKQHLPFMGGCCFFQKIRDETRGVRRSSPKPASGFRDCEVTSTAKCFGYRSQRSKHCRRRVSRPGHQNSTYPLWVGVVFLFTKRTG